jgi:hypothetical protein
MDPNRVTLRADSGLSGMLVSTTTELTTLLPGGE